MKGTFSSIFFKIGLFVILFLICQMIGGAISSLFFPVADFNTEVSLSSTETQNLRLVLFINNGFMFLIPGIIFSYLVHRSLAAKSVLTHRFPSIKFTLLSLLAVVAIYPFLMYVLDIMQGIHLLDWLQKQEEMQRKILALALEMDSVYSLVFCLFGMALLPAIGEEWIFRGILLQGLSKRLKNKHLSVWIIAFLFSFIHLQFHSFIPMLLLGAMLGYMTLWARNLWVAIIVHFSNNAFTVIQHYKMPNNGLESLSINAWQGVISLLLAVGMMLILNVLKKKMNE